MKDKYAHHTPRRGYKNGSSEKDVPKGLLARVIWTPDPLTVQQAVAEVDDGVTH